MAKVEAELNQIRPFTLLGVTILTSFSQQSLPPPLNERPISEQVLSLAEMAFSAGLRGFVCSPLEVSSVRSSVAKSFLVTPGVRMPGDALGDQVRVLTPGEAVLAGSNALVVGRPILQAKDPVQALDAILADIASQLKKKNGR